MILVELFWFWEGMSFAGMPFASILIFLGKNGCAMSFPFDVSFYVSKNRLCGGETGTNTPGR